MNQSRLHMGYYDSDGQIGPSYMGSKIPVVLNPGRSQDVEETI